MISEDNGLAVGIAVDNAQRVWRHLEEGLLPEELKEALKKLPTTKTIPQQIIPLLKARGTTIQAILQTMPPKNHKTRKR